LWVPRKYCLLVSRPAGAPTSIRLESTAPYYFQLQLSKLQGERGFSSHSSTIELATRTAISFSWTGILNHLFFWPEQYRRTGGMSIVFLFDENPDVASAGSGGAAVGGARSIPDRAARSNSERAAPSACVGRRFSAP
jgi:hypothetical protein